MKGRRTRTTVGRAPSRGMNLSFSQRLLLRIVEYGRQSQLLSILARKALRTERIGGSAWAFMVR
jgi:hypothetical protein